MNDRDYMKKQDIKSMTLASLQEQMAEFGEPKFRAKQIFEALHKKNAVAFDEITTLSKELRGILNEKYYINDIKIQKRLVSAQDGTVKYLYGLKDGEKVESVFLSYRHGDSLCVSTQAGCRMGCVFCASTKAGLVRNLTASEMLDQVYMTAKDSNRRVSGVVLMGIGEPLDNFENLLSFLEILSCPEGLNMSLRHVSLSTSGIVDKIDLLAAKRLPLTLSVSLHAPDDETRGKLMPVNNKWGIDELLSACARYFEATGRRVSFEYALIDGVNDGENKARELARKLCGLNCHVNLIPVNAVMESGLNPSKAEAVEKFKDILQKSGITVTVRRKLGGDINAACGQLRIIDNVQCTIDN